MVYNFDTSKKQDDKKVSLLTDKINTNNVYFRRNMFYRVFWMFLTYFTFRVCGNLFEHDLLYFITHDSIVMLLISFAISGVIHEFVSMFFDEKKTYKEMRKALGCSFFVNSIKPKDKKDCYQIDDIDIPDLEINYDIDNSDDNIAIIVRLSENRYKILSLLDNAHKKTGKKITISSEKLGKLLDCNESTFIEEQMLIFHIGKLNKKIDEGKSVDFADLDSSLIITEFMYLDFN